MEAAVGKIIMLQVDLVALVEALLGRILVNAQLAVIEARYKQVPTLVCLSPRFCLLHLIPTPCNNAENS